MDDKQRRKQVYLSHLSDSCDPKGFLPYTRSQYIQRTLKELEENIEVNFILILQQASIYDTPIYGKTDM